MRNNKNDRNIMKRLDTSNESHKYSYKKNNEKDKKNKNESKYLFNMNKKINNTNNNYTTYQNINRNKSNIIKKRDNINEQTNYISKKNNKINLLNVQDDQNRVSKNKNLKYQNSSYGRDCHTPDQKLNKSKYKIDSSINKKDNLHNISLFKSNIQKNSSFIEYHYKNSSKYFLKRCKSKNNDLSNDRKKPITPDKSIKTRNVKNGNNRLILNKYRDSKRIKEPINKYNFRQNKLAINLNKSFNNNNNINNSRSTDNNDIFNNSYISNHMLKEARKRKTPNKYSRDRQRVDSKLNLKKSKEDKFYILTNNTSKDKISKSFCSQSNSHDRKSQSFIKKNNNILFSNLKLNQMKKDFNKIYKQKINTRSKSSDVNYNKKNDSNNKFLFNKNNNYLNIKNNSKKRHIINNVSYERLNNNYLKNNNQIYNQLTNPNNYYTNFNLSKNIGSYNSTQINNNNKANIKSKENINKKNKNSKTFLEMAQQKINNKKFSNQKNCKYMGVNNFITKSSTNTNDDNNSSHSIISRNNQIMDSIEEIHFNFVNVLQTSRNLMKIQENIEFEKILNNDANSTVIIVEERDID